MIKLNDDELAFLSALINEIEVEKSFNQGEDFITIDKKVFDKIYKYLDIKEINTPLSLFIKEQIKTSTNRLNLSCRKIANEYYKKTGIRTGKSTVNNIMKKHFGYKYLKTTIKNISLKTDKSIISCFAFIKIVVRALKLGFSLIFIDESKIELSNNHYRAWRFPCEQVYFGKNSKQKNNLLLAIGNNSVYHYKITSENTTSDVFLQFLIELNEKLVSFQDKKFILILDNLSSHKTEEVFQYLNDNKINTVFNVAYCSNFNSIELCFRSIKKIIYSNVYDSIEKVNIDVCNYLEGNGITKTLLYNYKETLNQYIYFNDENKNFNLNDFLIEKI